MSEVKVRIAAGTNVGLIRQNNEDNFVVCPDLAASIWTIPQANETVDLGNLGSLLVVADGMGGANAGEVASAIAIDTVQKLFTPDRLQAVVGDDRLMQEFMKDTVKEADMNIYNHSHADAATQGMGTTIVMAWLYGHRAYVCWCGDSRCYAYRASETMLERLSRDHSYVQELVDRGELNAELAFDHPLSNVITRCLGAEDKRAEPETRIYELHTGDVIMLCSDGLCGLCHDEEIVTVMAEHKGTATELKDDLITAALSAGGHDNVTVALCSVEIEGEQTAEPAAAATADAGAAADGKQPDDLTTPATADGDKPTDGAAPQQEEKLQDTVKPNPVPVKPKKHFGWVVWLLLLAAAAYGAYYYFFLRDKNGPDSKDNPVTLVTDSTDRKTVGSEEVTEEKDDLGQEIKVEEKVIEVEPVKPQDEVIKQPEQPAEETPTVTEPEQEPATSGEKAQQTEEHEKDTTKLNNQTNN